jgi:hypothetical protein
MGFLFWIKERIGNSFPRVSPHLSRNWELFEQSPKRSPGLRARLSQRESDFGGDRFAVRQCAGSETRAQRAGSETHALGAGLLTPPSERPRSGLQDRPTKPE